MSELDDLEGYADPEVTPRNKRTLRYMSERRRGRVSEAEADRIFERVKAEIAKSKAKSEDRK